MSNLHIIFHLCAEYPLSFARIIKKEHYIFIERRNVMFGKRKSCCHACTVFMWVFHVLAVAAIGASLAYAYCDKVRTTAKKIKTKAEDCIDNCCDGLENICE